MGERGDIIKWTPAKCANIYFHDCRFTVKFAARKFSN